MAGRAYGVMLFVLACVLAARAVSSQAATEGAGSPPLVAKVDTRIGSGGKGFGVGGINPGPQVPFGAMRLGPDTSFDGLVLSWQHYGGYYFDDNSIDAFSHTHLVGAGVGDWGNIGVMPVRAVTANLVDGTSNYRSTFSHETEVAEPGLYSVELETPKVGASLTVSGTLSGIHQYVFHSTTAGSAANVLVDVCHTINENACSNATVSTKVEDGGIVVSGSVKVHGSLSGRSRIGGIWVYFYARVPSGKSAQLWEDKKLLSAGVASAATTSGSLGAAVAIDTSAPDASGDVTAEVRIGLSFISISNAQNNLNVQQGAQITFDEARARTQAEWEGMLSRVAIEAPAASSEQVTKFYGGMYRAFLAPTKYTEANNQYLGFDFKVHTWGDVGDYHSDMSLWDIHRSQVPLLNLLAPEIARDTSRSMLAMYQEGGKLPRWPLANVYTGCMVASHGIVAIADSLVKGIKGINASLAYDAAYSACNGQDHGDDYAKLGYVPIEEFGQAPSLTLAYAFDDWATSQIAALTGHKTEEAQLLNRSKNYRNIWESTEMFFCAKDTAGTIKCPADPALPYPIEKEYTESNAWQYQWFVPGDPEGLVALFPSVQEYVSRLNFFFNKSLSWPLRNFMPNPYYWPGNEPDLFAPWQFNFAGNDHAYLTQYWTRKMVEVAYSTEGAGLPGNDDFGTMSAWECWAYLGLYPISGSDRFSIGAPAFSSVTVQLPTASLDAMVLGPSFARGERDQSTTVLTIVAHGASPQAVYVRNATANGVPLKTPFVTQADLLNGGSGGKLEFWMSTEPSPWSGAM